MTSATPGRARIPALINEHAGSAARARDALGSDDRFETRDVPPDRIAETVREEAAAGTKRILVSGGDGTIASAAGAAAGTSLEIAVLPGGTLNHFARDHGLPVDTPAALDLAANGTAQAVDLGVVNGRVMLNTSSVGAYVDFVRHREARKRFLGYRLASLVAAISVWLRPRWVAVGLGADDGTRRQFNTPLLFVGVGEREFGRGGLGQRKPDGARALHILVVNERRRQRIAAMAFGALVRGVDEFLRTDTLDAHLVAEATVTLRHARGVIAVDGELLAMGSPLRFELRRDAVRMVLP